MVNLYDVIGFLGVIIAVYAYGRTQFRREYVKTYNYSFLNLISSLFLLVSLFDKWNPASFCTNTIWSGFSIYGLYRCYKYAKGKRRRS